MIFHCPPLRATSGNLRSPCKEMITEVEGEIDEKGEVVSKLNRDEILAQMQYLH